jgi:hypothetical protein
VAKIVLLIIDYVRLELLFKPGVVLRGGETVLVAAEESNRDLRDLAQVVAWGFLLVVAQ